MTTDLVRATSLEMQISRAEEIAKELAIEQFAMASVEEVMLKIAEKRIAIFDARRKLVMAVFNETDVNRMGEKLAKNRNAAEKLLSIWGGKFELLKDNDGRPLMDLQIIKDDPNVGEVRIYTYYGRYTRPDGVMVEEMGSFSSKDPFFAKVGKDENVKWKRIDEINLVDIMAAAQTETFKRAIFRGIGLGEWTAEEGKELLSTSKGHDFQKKGAEAPAAAAGTGTSPKPQEDVLVGFGSQKGKKPSELDDKNLDWYVNAYQENVQDPKKVKYKGTNQAILTALQVELARRKATAAQGASGPAMPPTAKPQEGSGVAPDPGVEGARQPLAGKSPARTEAGPDAITPRGKRMGDLWVRLTDVTKSNARLIAGMVKLATREWGLERASLSDLTDEELSKLLQMSDETLADLSARAAQ